MSFNSGFAPGDRVRVWLPNGTIESGIIKQVSWQKLPGKIPKAEYGITLDCGIYAWYTQGMVYHEIIKTPCECGAEKVGHPGHDWYCPKFKGKA